MTYTISLFVKDGLILNQPSKQTLSNMPFLMTKYIITKWIFQQSKTWANITYGTQAEAQAAIEDVDGRPPHKFSVKFALSKEELERRKKEDIVKC